MRAFRRALPWTLVALLLAGCPRRNINRCANDADCSGGTACDPSTNSCHLPDADGGTAGSSSGAVPSSSLPGSGSGGSSSSSGAHSGSAQSSSGVTSSGPRSSSAGGSSGTSSTSSSSGGGALQLTAPRLNTGGRRLTGAGLTLDVQLGVPGTAMGAGSTQLDNGFLR